jgi:hypothetical protein
MDASGEPSAAQAACSVPDRIAKVLFFESSRAVSLRRNPTNHPRITTLEKHHEIAGSERPRDWRPVPLRAMHVSAATARHAHATRNEICPIEDTRHRRLLLR